MSGKKARGKHSIHGRPASIDNLESYTDLEGDTIFGLDTKDRLLTHTERKSGLGSISLAIGCNAARVLPNKPRRILKESLAKVMLPPLLTAMGAEFSSWPCRLRKHWLQMFTLLTRINPVKRGRNENFNGLIRDFILKALASKSLRL